jgi:hypothetical protein
LKREKKIIQFSVSLPEIPEILEIPEIPELPGLHELPELHGQSRETKKVFSA